MTYFNPCPKPTREKKSLKDKYKDYDLFRSKILGRDRHMCQLCGKTQIYLHIHHIKGREYKKATEERNALALCPDCHLTKVHNHMRYFRPLLQEIVDRKYERRTNG